jgi:hypothetical protein
MQDVSASPFSRAVTLIEWSVVIAIIGADGPDWGWGSMLLDNLEVIASCTAVLARARVRRSGFGGGGRSGLIPYAWGRNSTSGN